jgi:hypothetical protein
VTPERPIVEEGYGEGGGTEQVSEMMKGSEAEEPEAMEEAMGGLPI